MSRPTLDSATAASQHRRVIDPNPSPRPHAARRTAVASCRVRCQCGAIEGTLIRCARALRLVCYCHDCQAFAEVLGQGARLDPLGGTGVLLTRPAHLNITRGSRELGCLRLTPTGLLRWYARCCSTPVGSTLANPRLSLMGLNTTCLDPGADSVDDLLGPVRAWTWTAGARGGLRPEEIGRRRVTAFALFTILRARLGGDARRSPFFNPDTGAPIATPRVLTPTEHARVLTGMEQAQA